jgi:hypothetical protein
MWPTEAIKQFLDLFLTVVYVFTGVGIIVLTLWCDHLERQERKKNTIY